MKSSDVRRKYIEFFKSRGHVEVPSSPLVPENDPTTLFISAGMQPLIHNILGEPHPAGKRLVNSQKAVRMQDIDEVGDNRHTTFLEMLGNWSFGDSFKKEQLPWIFEFLTKELGLDPKRLSVSVFEGTKEVPRDGESVQIWKKLGIPEDKIFYYGTDKNWWSRAGGPEKMPAGEPGGPDSEVFYEFTQVKHDPKFGKQCHPNCDCGRFMEVANSVFMQYRKKEDGGLEELFKKSVDFGGGLERMAAVTEETPDVFGTDLFFSIIQTIETLSKKSYTDHAREMRIVADHIKASVFMVDAGVEPGNKERGYVLRRLIRRSVVKMLQLDVIPLKILPLIIKEVFGIYEGQYLSHSQPVMSSTVIGAEIDKFQKTLDKGVKKLQTSIKVDGDLLFDLKQSYGFPPEVALELLAQWGRTYNRDELFEALKIHEQKHQELSRTAAKGMFKGGLADRSEETTKLHSVTHLLHAALRTILGDHVQQKGSNITAERLRFDFSHPTKLTKEELEGVEGLVNEKIKENLPVSLASMDTQEALKSGALAFFGERYGEKVNVYSMGAFSREICGGPHVSFTGSLGHFTIVKEESAGAGVRRIYATVAPYEAARGISAVPQSKT